MFVKIVSNRGGDVEVAVCAMLSILMRLMRVEADFGDCSFVGVLVGALRDGELALAFVLKAGDLLEAEAGDLGDLLDGVAALEHLLSRFEGFAVGASLLALLNSLLDSLFEDVV